mmetsp:Transcript_6579/g.12404  ORF Transcript_6579/g.12404 Transcript_6579/m.12404 type:complete len:233 (-) Transcript_6579:833-1531(-)
MDPIISSICKILYITQFSPTKIQIRTRHTMNRNKRSIICWYWPNTSRCINHLMLVKMLIIRNSTTSTSMHGVGMSILRNKIRRIRTLWNVGRMQRGTILIRHGHVRWLGHISTSCTTSLPVVHIDIVIHKIIHTRNRHCKTCMYQKFNRLWSHGSPFHRKINHCQITIRRFMTNRNSHSRQNPIQGTTKCLGPTLRLSRHPYDVIILLGLFTQCRTQSMRPFRCSVTIIDFY